VKFKNSAGVKRLSERSLILVVFILV